MLCSNRVRISNHNPIEKKRYMNNQTIKLLAVALLVPTLSQARQISGVVLSENDSTVVVGAVC